MSPALWIAALSVLPALALLAGYPRRPWAAAAVFVLAAAFAMGLLESLPGFLSGWPALAAAFWSLLGCGYAWLTCRRDRKSGAARESSSAALRRSAREADEELERAKAESLSAARGHKQALALYGLVKGLTEALSWEEMRPRLEAAVEEYLGVSDFAFYVAAEAGAAPKPLLVRGLSSSLGSSWATLERYLQERSLSPTQPHPIEAPEKAVLVPISDGEWLGSFYARTRAGAAPAELVGRALSFAQDIAFAFRRIKLLQEMEDLSRIDGLTGVHRRGDFEERLKEEILRAQTFKTPLSLMLLDIDHFKELNDRYGHPFGDGVLRRIGEILNASVYDTDFVARYGGEEFVVVLPRAEPAGALRRAEAVRRAVEEESFPLGFGAVRASLSIGVAHFPRDAATGEELVAQADAALYRAKARGRNQVVDCASPG